MKLSAETVALLCRTDQCINSFAVPLAQFLENRGNRFAIACLRQRRCLDQSIGHTAHGRDDHHDIALARGRSNDLDHFADAGRVSNRGPTELHHSKRLFPIAAGPTLAGLFPYEILRNRFGCSRAAAIRRQNIEALVSPVGIYSASHRTSTVRSLARELMLDGEERPKSVVQFR